jgi:hypothetical protein
MLNSLKKTAARKGVVNIQNIFYFVVFFGLIYFWVDPKIIFHGLGHFMWYNIWAPWVELFSDFPAYPGKEAEYLSAILSHYFFYGWAGALIITAIAWFVCELTDVLLVGAGIRLRLVRFVIPSIVLIQYGKYHHYATYGLSLLFALILLCIYIKISMRHALNRFVLFTIFSMLIYVFAAKAYLVFAVVCVIFEVLKNRRFSLAFSEAFTGTVIPSLVGVFIFQINCIEACHYVFPIERSSIHENTSLREIHILLYSLLFFLPAFSIVFFLQTTQKFLTKKIHSENKGYKLRVIEILIVVSSVVLAFFVTCDSGTRKQLRIAYLSNQREWEELLREARGFKAQEYDVFLCHEVNRALYHTGRLGYDMFSYPQHPQALVLQLDKREKPFNLIRSYVKRTHTLYEMGLINYAEDSAYDAVAVLGYFPEGLKILCLTSMIKGQTAASLVYLNALNKDFIYDKWANKYLSIIKNDPLLSENKAIQRMRSLIPAEDTVSVPTNVQGFLAPLLESNENNRMAFEYKMADFLVNNQLNGIIENLKYLDNFDYPEIPRQYEEAIVMYESLTGKMVDLGGRQISEETRGRFAGFSQIANRYGSNKWEAFSELSESYRDSYFFYVTYGGAYGRTGAKI